VQQCLDCKYDGTLPVDVSELPVDAVGAGSSRRRGTLYSYVVCHHPLPPWADGPYAVLLVELHDGIRLVCGAVDIPLDELEIDMPCA